MRKLLILSLVLGMVLGISGVVVGSGQQANEEGAMFQMWDLAPANLEAFDNPQGICDENLVETLIVFANGVNGISSEETLDMGTTYVLRVSGIAYAGDTIYFDAKYSITERIPEDEWTDIVSGYEGHGPELLDLLVNA